MKRTIYFYLMCLIFLTFFVSSLMSEEGMLPLSEIHKLDLKSKGFLLDAKELYNPDGVSLIDGIINLSGCTASFVSKEGLMLTNYHCAFRAIQSVTTKEQDYMHNGFSALNRSEEVQAKGYTVRINESYKDVSKEVLSVVNKKMTYAQRTRAIEKRMKEIEVRIEKKNPGKRAEVAEMFAGKTYVLFIYRYLKDVRLVYAPPRSIGEYGGEIDNWMWPRHTGDFAFMRAYVAPDGSTADYSSDNVPFHPKRFLKVAPQGVNTEDFVFILGYPGHTHRHKTSYFLSFEEEVRMPYVVDLYSWIIDLKEKMSEQDRSITIKLAPSLKGLWNTKKRYNGQLKGLKGLKLAKKREEQEKALQKFIDSDPKLKEKYGSLLEKIKKVYDEIRKNAAYELTLENLLSGKGSSTLLDSVFTVYEASIERRKKDTERESAYMNRNFDRTQKWMMLALENYYEPADKAVLKELLMRAARFKGEHQIPAVVNLIQDKNPEEAIDAFLEKAYKETTLADPEVVMGLFRKTTSQLETMDDPFIVLARALYPTYRKLKEYQKQEKGILDELSAQLIDVKKQFIGKEFIPDANSTLRLTFGRIRGYSPRDAVYMHPFTTLTGVIEKNSGQHPFDAPQKLMDLSRANDFGPFKHPELKDVPVCMLYNMDTTGGNSGSPVLNAKGELVGLNFDRVFEATINDYAWDEAYSRSIGVDIRYILWFLQKFSGADYLLKEMEVK